MMQQGDVSFLRLLEALLQALPHFLLQTFIYLTLEQTEVFPVLSALLSLLSLSWALVAYSRFMCLLKPGHLSMPWAALLCQLLWRMGMIGTRVMALVVFARVYHFWVFAVGGAHWLVMSFWLVAQQTDVISRPCYWKMFNVLIGAVYVFCFINVRDGPSRYRVAIFYVIMLLENCILLLLATDFLQEAVWSGVKLSVAVMSGFLIGCAALIVYYTLLHPKSTEISQSFRKIAHVTGVQDKGNASYLSGRWYRSPGRGTNETIDSEDLKLQKQLEDKEMTKDVEGLVTWMDSTNKHHHWLLLKLAMKTGNVSKIYAAFGDGGFGDVVTPRCLKAVNNGGQRFGEKIPVTTNCGELEMFNPGDIVESERWLMGKVDGDVDYKGSPPESSAYVTLGNTRTEDRLELKVPDKFSHGCDGVGKRTIGPREDINDLDALSDGGRDNFTLYFSANTEGILPSVKDSESEVDVQDVHQKPPKDTPIKEVPEQEAVKAEEYPVICVSPILTLATNSNFQRSIAPDVGSLGNDSSLSDDDSEMMETETVFGTKAPHFLTVGALGPLVRARLVQEDQPCFTSTPKPPSTNQELGPRKDSKARRKLSQLHDQVQ
ncbi:XK-related protein 5 [Discoglossus pictus]